MHTEFNMNFVKYKVRFTALKCEHGNNFQLKSESKSPRAQEYTSVDRNISSLINALIKPGFFYRKILNFKYLNVSENICVQVGTAERKKLHNLSIKCCIVSRRRNTQFCK